eukprot:XP_016661071.1 PREDICTED: putative nuclease HARBI1 [Acyrthosiphon pisum]
MPGTELERQSVYEGFKQLRQFPNVIGAIDCTHIRIHWPGSVHDSTISDNSLLRAQFENHEFGDAVLLGDGGYACRNYLMTPLANPITEAEKCYQKAQIGTRNVIERTFGVWKRRLSVLSVGVRTQIPTTLFTIIATAVLHNMLIKAYDPLPIDDTLLNENLLQQVPVYPVQQTGNIASRTLIKTIFN